MGTKCSFGARATFLFVLLTAATPDRTNSFIHNSKSTSTHWLMRKSSAGGTKCRDSFVPRRQRITSLNKKSDDQNSASSKLLSLDMVSRIGSLFDGEIDDKFEGFAKDLGQLDLTEKWLQLQQSARLTRPSKDGLSNIYQNILSRTSGRQRFVTGKDPLLITVEENPTRRWIKNTGTASILINGTSVDKSLASVEKFQWVEVDERQQLLDQYAMVSMELIGEINMKKPGYINVLPTTAAGATAAVRRAAGAGDAWNRWQNSALMEQLEKDHLQGPCHDRLWVSGFSLAGQVGYIHSVDVETGHIGSVNSRTGRFVLWPNEAASVPKALFRSQDIPLDASSSTTYSASMNYSPYHDALLVSEGFLVPGKDKGGLYVVKNPCNPDSEWTVCLTGGNHHMVGPEAENMGWFYHRSVWIDLTGDGRKSILTARAKVSSRFSSNNGASVNGMAETQLLWLEQPKPSRYDTITGTPLEDDGTVFDPFSPRHLPWKAHVLSEGADVMFNVADLDTEDDTVEVIASHFFGRKVTLSSIQYGLEPKIIFERTIDDKCGAAFGSILVDLDCGGGTCKTHENRVIIDSGSTVTTLKPGDTFSHILVTSHECRIKEDAGSTRKVTENVHNGLDDLSYDEEECRIDGGSLFAFRVPDGKDAWKTEPWLRTTVASGFTVAPKLDNMINPGAPGFVYTFHPQKGGPLSGKRPLIAIAGDCSESAYILRPIGDGESQKTHADPSARYKLMVEIECGATVGSIGIGYDDFLSVEQESEYAKLYIPLFERDKILVFAMGSGVDPDYGENGGW
jgi:hypothetical protein